MSIGSLSLSESCDVAQPMLVPETVIDRRTIAFSICGEVKPANNLDFERYAPRATPTDFVC